MKNYSTYYDAPRNHDDRELADVLTAISVVSRRLARKLDSASRRNERRTDYECPYMRERRMHSEALRD